MSWKEMLREICGDLSTHMRACNGQETAAAER